MGFNLHADNSNDPPEVRNWRVHLIALVVSMGAIASECLRELGLWPVRRKRIVNS